MSKLQISSEKIIGILGAGQLARMSAQKAQSLGYQVAIYAQKDENEPAAQITALKTIGPLNDLDAMTEFSRHCDVVTLENEFIDAELLKDVEKKSGTKIYPSPKAFAHIQDKYHEKQFFKSCGLELGAYQKIHSLDELLSFLKAHPKGVILKACKGGYDGYGNANVNNEADAKKAYQKFKNVDLLAEAKLPLKRELAITFACNGEESILYPIVETVQENHICTHVIAPAQVSEKARLEIEQATRAFAKQLNTRGIFSLEFFELEDGKILINESAPRPHNSAHYSLNTCRTDQFENHIRAIMGLPLGQTNLVAAYGLMFNLLGTQNRAAMLELDSELMTVETYIHLYGKKESRPGRKMGHVNLVGDNLEKLLELKDKWTNGYQL